MKRDQVTLWNKLLNRKKRSLYSDLITLANRKRKNVLPSKKHYDFSRAICSSNMGERNFPSFHQITYFELHSEIKLNAKSKVKRQNMKVISPKIKPRIHLLFRLSKKTTEYFCSICIFSRQISTFFISNGWYICFISAEIVVILASNLIRCFICDHFS